jgi:hypothetical protein
MNIRRELGDVIQVVNLLWTTSVFLLFEYEFFRLVVSEIESGCLSACD